MKKLAALFLSLAAITAVAQEPAQTERSVPVYAKTTPNPVVVPEDTPAKPVIKQDAAPRKSNAAAKQDTKTQISNTKQSK